MSNFNFAAGDKIAQAIDKRIITIAKQVANKSTVNRTVYGRVTAKNNGFFSLKINNTIYTNVIALKSANYINVGDKVVCLVPNNQFNDLLILGVADGSLLSASGYVLNQASSTELGGIKANNRTVEDQEVRIDPNTGFLYYSLGKSIESIEKTSTSGLVDTYTITFTDGTFTTFTITNADQIDIQYINGQLQWKYESESTWTTLFTVDSALSTTSANPIQNKIVTEALNGKANLTGENTFNGGQTIQGNVYVGGQVNVPNGPVTVQNINVAESISSLQNNVSSINNNINTNVVQNISTNVNGDNFSLIQTLINLNTQATTQQSTNIPLANSTTAGLMSSSDFASLQNLEDRVGNLEGKTTRLLYTASTNPTADDINSFVTGLGYTPPFEGIAVVVDETFHIWHYYDNGSIGWRDDGVDTVSNFTNTTAGIILGSTENGKVFAETDGTGSINGWDDLNTNVNNLQSTTQSLSNSINNLNTQVETNTTNITNLQNSKININQGIANTGKVLTVGSDGNVTPQDIPSSSGTVVNINNVPQAQVNFTSDPQSQITANTNALNGKANKSGGNNFSGEQYFNGATADIGVYSVKPTAKSLSKFGLTFCRNRISIIDEYGGIFYDYSNKKVFVAFDTLEYDIPYLVERGDNFRKWSDGTLECWGTEQLPNPVIFPRPFIEVPNMVTLGGVDLGWEALGIKKNSLSTTGFTAESRYNNQIFYYNAKGKWK